MRARAASRGQASAEVPRTPRAASAYACPRTGKRTSYPPGTFSWVDLATTDAAAAKSFYAGLYGWELDDTDAGGGAVYTLCRVDGDAVCGLYEMSPRRAVRPRATSFPPRAVTQRRIPLMPQGLMPRGRWSDPR